MSFPSDAITWGAIAILFGFVWQISARVDAIYQAMGLHKKNGKG